jgi:pentapeptide repeat protein
MGALLDAVRRRTTRFRTDDAVPDPAGVPPSRTGDLDEYQCEVRDFLGTRLTSVFGDAGQAEDFAKDLARGTALLLVVDAPLGLALACQLIGAPEEELSIACDRAAVLREARQRAYIRVLGIMSAKRDGDAARQLADELAQARDRDRTYMRELEAACASASRLRSDLQFTSPGTRPDARKLYDTTFAVIVDRPDFPGEAARHQSAYQDARLDDALAEVRALADGLGGDLLRVDGHARMVAAALSLDLRGADLRGADLGEADLRDVLWSPETTWPDELQAVMTERSTETEPGTFRVGDEGKAAPRS